jgi:ADP-dependent NAD(P)H-hydrate dehydratase
VKSPRVERITDTLLKQWPLPSLVGSTGKEDRGRIGVVGGSARIPGGALLAGQAALRAGAGKLHIATAASVQAAMAIAVPEAKVSPVIEDADGNLFRIRRKVQAELAKSDALLVGPGLETCGASARIVGQLVRSCGCALVLDAGALEGFLDLPRPRGGSLITPHFGEMARLLDRPAEQIERDPGQIAVDFAIETGTVVVLKSPRTFVASPDGACWVHEDGSVGLGTSGSGDVLAGLIAGLLARGASLTQAAVWGVRLHGKAGEILSRRLGAVGFLASEISPEVPALLQQLDEACMEAGENKTL